MPDDYPDVLVLRHFEGLSFPVVAERLAPSVAGVKSV
jgi:hypothetical protein